MRNYSIDSVKMLGSLAVVFMHVVNYMPTTNFANYWTYDWYFPVLNLAVPIFFVFAGYFLYPKDDKAIVNYAFKILILLLAYSLVYLFIKLPMEILVNRSQEGSILQSVTSYFYAYSLGDYFIGIVGSEHLWFLAALFYASWILYFFRRVGLSATWCFAIGAGLFILSFLPPFSHLWQSLLLYGGFIKAYFYVAMGYMIAGRHINTKAIKLSVGLCIVLLVIFASNYQSIWVLESFLAVTVFYTTVLCKYWPGRATILSRYSQYSLGIYLLHIIFTGIFTVARSLYPNLNLVNPIFVVTPVFLICLLGSVLLFPLTERFVHQPLIHLFNKVAQAIKSDSYIKPTSI